MSIFGHKKRDEKLNHFQTLMRTNLTYWQAECDRMDIREAIYHGSPEIRATCKADEEECGNGSLRAYHVRNISQEIIESQIDNNIPYPKVTAVRKEDEERAKIAEDYLRSVIDLLPFEEINDMAERTTKIQGGVFYLVEYDADRDKKGLYPISVKVIHPKWVIPQYGVFTSVEEMDYIFLRVPVTKESIKRRYGIDAENFAEEEPEIKSAFDSDNGEDMITQYYCYYRNDKGGIGLFSWTNDTVLCDMEDYQERTIEVCTVCGKPREGDICPNCGNDKFKKTRRDEELYEDIETKKGKIYQADVNGERTTIPFYKPDCYPLILQKNISVFGQLLGVSDIDKIADQQNTTNRIENAIIERLITGGTYMTLPPQTDIEVNTKIGKEIRLENASDKAMMGTFDLQTDISQYLAYLSQTYEEARQEAGLTDSYQGRRDPTATSGKAKELSAAQAASRIESKKIMKNSAFANIYEMIFKLSLAYFDSPRDMIVKKPNGETEGEQFSRYDYLDQNEEAWEYDDEFLFSCDVTSALAANREGMWQEVNAALTSGALGNPGDVATLIRYWEMMDQMHYPMAGTIKASLEEQFNQQNQMPAQEQLTPEQIAEIQTMARQDAARDMGGNR